MFLAIINFTWLKSFSNSENLQILLSYTFTSIFGVFICLCFIVAVLLCPVEFVSLTLYIFKFPQLTTQ